MTLSQLEVPVEVNELLILFVVSLNAAIPGPINESLLFVE